MDTFSIFRRQARVHKIYFSDASKSNPFEVLDRAHSDLLSQIRRNLQQAMVDCNDEDVDRLALSNTFTLPFRISLSHTLAFEVTMYAL